MNAFPNTSSCTRARARARGLPLIAVLALLATPTAAFAAEGPAVTAQARTHHYDFVAYLDPPPGPVAQMCLVDTGVSITPDTPPDNPNGPIVTRDILPGVTGTGQGAPDYIHQHATAMAFYAAAQPGNDWGTTGLWPAARIVSVQAMSDSENGFAFDTYRRAISRCLSYGGLAVVNLSLGCAEADATTCEPTADEAARLGDAVGSAHNRNISVVASAGNGGPASPLRSPASAPGVFAVAAGSGASSAGESAFCPFATRAPGFALIASGCEADSADTLTGAPVSNDSGGSSAAAAQVSAALALLRTYRPDLTYEGAEEALRSSADATPGGPVLDVEAAFRRLGLGALVDAARARMPAPAIAAPAAPPSVTAPVSRPPSLTTRPTRTRFSPPKLRRAIWRRGVLEVSVTNRRADALLEVKFSRPRCDREFAAGSTRRLRRASGRVRVRSRWRPSHVQLRYVPDATSLRTSSSSVSRVLIPARHACPKPTRS